MSRPALLALIFLSVAMNASAQVLLRWAARSGFDISGGWTIAKGLNVFLRPGILGGLACYAISVVIWVAVLSESEVSFAYPFLGLGFVLVTMASWLLLGEALTVQRLAGTVLIAFGVVVLARS